MEEKRHQIEARESFFRYFYDDENPRNRGIISMACGSGKSYTSYCIMRESIKTKNETFFIYATSRILLINQILNDFQMWFSSDAIDVVFLMQYSGTRKKDKNVETFSKGTLFEYLCRNKIVVVITTYMGSINLVKALSEINENCVFNYQPDLIFLDEAHNTAGSNDKGRLKLSQSLIQFSDEENRVFNPKKILFMTATPLKITQQNKASMFLNNDLSYSMDNSGIYGDVFYEYSFENAIKDGNIVNWEHILLDIKNEDDIKETYQSIMHSNLDNEKINFCIQSILLLKAIEAKDIRNILVYFCDTTEVSIFRNCIDAVNKNKNIEVYSIHSKETLEDNKRSITNFKIFDKEKRKIILCVDQFNEGVNLCLCDCVMFAKPKSSETEIVQCIGRALRNFESNDYIKHKAYVIIPTWIAENEESGDVYTSKFKTVREISDKMKGNAVKFFNRNAIKFNTNEQPEKEGLAIEILAKNMPNNDINEKIVKDASEIAEIFQLKFKDNCISNLSLQKLKEYITFGKIETMEDLGRLLSSKLCNRPHIEFKEFTSYSELLNSNFEIFSYDEAKSFIASLEIKFQDRKQWFDHYIETVDKAIGGLVVEHIDDYIRIPYHPSEYYDEIVPDGGKWTEIDWGNFLGYDPSITDLCFRGKTKNLCLVMEKKKVFNDSLLDLKDVEKFKKHKDTYNGFIEYIPDSKSTSSAIKDFLHNEYHFKSVHLCNVKVGVSKHNKFTFYINVLRSDIDVVGAAVTITFNGKGFVMHYDNCITNDNTFLKTIKFSKVQSNFIMGNSPIIKTLRNLKDEIVAYREEQKI